MIAKVSEISLSGVYSECIWDKCYFTNLSNYLWITLPFPHKKVWDAIHVSRSICNGFFRVWNSEGLPERRTSKQKSAANWISLDFVLTPILGLYFVCCLTFKPYCWWKKSCTTWDVKSPVNNGINYQPQLVQDFFHQQYHVVLDEKEDDIWYILC